MSFPVGSNPTPGSSGATPMVPQSAPPPQPQNADENDASEESNQTGDRVG